MYSLRIWPGLMSRMSVGIVDGGSTVVSAEPKNLIIGMSTRYASTPPAHMIAAMRGPMM